MCFALLPPIPATMERRYDGPVPALTAHATVEPRLIQRLAAESRAHGAKRRRGLGAIHAASDPWLRRHAAALADYREMAVSIAKAP